MDEVGEHMTSDSDPMRSLADHRRLVGWGPLCRLVRDPREADGLSRFMSHTLTPFQPPELMN